MNIVFQGNFICNSGKCLTFYMLKLIIENTLKYAELNHFVHEGIEFMAALMLY